MTTSGEAPRLAALRGPELGRRPRRRHGLVLLLYAAAAFGVLGLCLAALGPANELPEGMLSMSLVLMGAVALALGCALLLVGLLMLARAPSAQAGWYVDPVDRDIARWWDGQRWTEHTDRRSSEVVRLEPLVTSSRRRRVVGSWLLLGGLVVTTGCVLLFSAAPSPTTDVGDAATILAAQLLLPAVLVALVGLYLVLTLSADARPGWYADPLQAGSLRWWDGRDWGDSTAIAHDPVVGLV